MQNRELPYLFLKISDFKLPLEEVEIIHCREQELIINQNEGCFSSWGLLLQNEPV